MYNNSVALLHNIKTHLEQNDAIKDNRTYLGTTYWHSWKIWTMQWLIALLSWGKPFTQMSCTWFLPFVWLYSTSSKSIILTLILRTPIRNPCHASLLQLLCTEFCSLLLCQIDNPSGLIDYELVLDSDTYSLPSGTLGFLSSDLIPGLLLDDSLLFDHY